MNTLIKAQVIRVVRVLASTAGLSWVLAPHLTHGWASVAAGAGVAAVEYVVHAVWPQAPMGAITGVVGRFAQYLTAKTPKAQQTP